MKTHSRSSAPGRPALSIAPWYTGFVGILLLTLTVTITVQARAAVDTTADPGPADAPRLGNDFLTLIVEADPVLVGASIDRIAENWSASLLPMAIETYQYTRSSLARSFVARRIADETKVADVDDVNAVYYWLWNQAISPTADYADFKADFYRFIDPAFDAYFRGRQATARIRLDEIRWGGVHQDGIPPLRNPKMILAADATYLDDSNIVFGIAINGDARAYPKRILAWHEMFTDTIGGVPIAGVYCTLCGTVIPYRTEVDGVQYTLGTSGFLYRSNKLMYDRKTQSLWSTERGEPVLGPLVDRGISLPFESVVTTTWGEWKRRNPGTTVLSLDTGHQRDYGEGVAYADYFADDELMFNTPFRDSRLDNKREVLALRFAGSPRDQVAIDTRFLEENRLYTGRIGQQAFVVLTDMTGANRVYDPGSVVFASYDGVDTLTDENGRTWTVTEAALRDQAGGELLRLPYHRAFWFGWRAAFPQTKLIQ